MKDEELSRIGALCVNNKGVLCSDHTKYRGCGFDPKEIERRRGINPTAVMSRKMIGGVRHETRKI